MVIGFTFTMTKMIGWLARKKVKINNIYGANGDH